MHRDPARDEAGRTALSYAVIADDVTGARELLDGGAALSEADLDGRTALHLAAIHDARRCCALLLARGADVHAEDRWGNTPLMQAVTSTTSGEVVAALLGQGADPLHRNAFGVTPLATARQVGGAVAACFAGLEPP